MLNSGLYINPLTIKPQLFNILKSQEAKELPLIKTKYREILGEKEFVLRS